MQIQNCQNNRNIPCDPKNSKSAEFKFLCIVSFFSHFHLRTESIFWKLSTSLNKPIVLTGAFTKGGHLAKITATTTSLRTMLSNWERTTVVHCLFAKRQRIWDIWAEQETRSDMRCASIQSEAGRRELPPASHLRPLSKAFCRRNLFVYSTRECVPMKPSDWIHEQSHWLDVSFEHDTATLQKWRRSQNINFNYQRELQQWGNLSHRESRSLTSFQS